MSANASANGLDREFATGKRQVGVSMWGLDRKSVV